jgi:hypothetical protein
VLDAKTGAEFGYADIRPNGQDFTLQMQVAMAHAVVAQEQMVEEQVVCNRGPRLK